jgi:proteic killer suppression protein
MSIRTCRDKRTADFIAGKRVAAFQAFERSATRAIAKFQAVSRLVELRNPPSNRFEALSGDRSGQYSIRINDKWRICFRWLFTQSLAGADELVLEGEPYDVEIADYHGS